MALITDRVKFRGQSTAGDRSMRPYIDKKYCKYVQAISSALNIACLLARKEIQASLPAKPFDPSEQPK